MKVTETPSYFANNQKLPYYLYITRKPLFVNKLFYIFHKKEPIY